MIFFSLAVSTPSISLSVLSGDLRTGSAQPLILQCLASLTQYDDSGDYTFNFSWRRGSSNVLGTDLRRRILSNSTGGYSRLTIAPPTTEDNVFTCIAQAEQASNRSRPSSSGAQTITITVQGRNYKNTISYVVLHDCSFFYMQHFHLYQ